MNGSADTKTVVESRSGSRSLRVMVWLAMVSCCLYACLYWLSLRFDYDSPGRSRPILFVLLTLGVAFAVYLLAIAICRRASSDRRVLVVILAGAFAFRAILLPSVPIQEVDIYRYMWDGAVLAHGASPFGYCPEEVLSAPSGETTDNRLARLVQLRDSDAELNVVLQRVHFRHLPTVYPPVSQAVFAAAAVTTPQNASVALRLTIMKAWLLLFDLATLLLVLWLLRLAGRPAALCVVYGWCPLLMKEVANSGHLDSIAIFFTTLSICLLGQAWANHDAPAAISAGQGRGRRLTSPWLLATGAAFALGLGVGAKLYPVVLTPLLAVACVRCTGWRRSLLPAGVVVLTAILVLWPMRPNPRTGSWPIEENAERAGEAESGEAAGPRPALGLKTFLTRWEMNDFLFLLLMENLKPRDAIPEGQVAWFSIVPESWREIVIGCVPDRWSVDRWGAAFLFARCVTAVVFLSVAAGLAWSIRRRERTADLFQAAFLTLVWFWLLSPTQNPWYLAWVLPLLPFARNRAWLALSGLVLLYYLRFWLRYHFPDTTVLGTAYIGYVFFDLVVTWIEFAPWFLWLACSSISDRRRGAE